MYHFFFHLWSKFHSETFSQNVAPMITKLEQDNETEKREK